MIRDVDRSIRSDPISDSSDQIIAVVAVVVAVAVAVAAVVAVAVVAFVVATSGEVIG